MPFEYLTFTTGLVLTIGILNNSGVKIITVLHFINNTNKALHGRVYMSRINSSLCNSTKCILVY